MTRSLSVCSIPNSGRILKCGQLKAWSNQMPRGLVLAFYVFMLTVPFEAAFAIQNVDTGQGYLTISKMVGYVLFVTALFHYRRFIRAMPPAFVMLAAYLLIYFLSAAFTSRGEHWQQFIARFMTTIQLVVSGYIGYYLFQDYVAGCRAWLFYAAACCGVALLELGGLTRVAFGNTTDRMVAFGEDPNFYAVVMGVGLVVLTEYVFHDKLVTPGRVMLGDKHPVIMRGISIIAILIILKVIIDTGSRGGLLATLGGLAVVAVMPQERWSWTRRWIGMAGILFAGFFWLSTSESAVQRWSSLFYEGDTAHRNVIQGASIEMLAEHPFFGYGSAESGYVLGERLGIWTYRATHNTFLDVGISVGLFGGLFFFVFLCFCVQGAVRAARTRNSVMPLALLTVMFIAALSLNIDISKAFWLVAAYTLSVGAADSQNPMFWNRDRMLTDSLQLSQKTLSK